MRFEEVHTEYVGIENRLWHAWVSYRWDRGVPLIGTTKHENARDIYAYGCTEKEARRKLKTAVKTFLRKLNWQVQTFHVEVATPKLPKDLL